MDIRLIILYRYCYIFDKLNIQFSDLNSTKIIYILRTANMEVIKKNPQAYEIYSLILNSLNTPVNLQ